MPDREWLLQQAATCHRLAKSTTDAALAQRLAKLAREYEQEANQADKLSDD